MINILFELIMRYCDYSTFQKCSVLSKECNRICRKLVSELKRVKICNYYYESYEVFWNKKRQGLTYYVNENYLKIIDYVDGEVLATYVYNVMSEYIFFKEQKFKAKMDFTTQKISFSPIKGYGRKYLSLKPIQSSHFFSFI
jgi:hypothetical protein